MKPSEFYRENFALISIGSNSDSQALNLNEKLIDELDKNFIDIKEVLDYLVERIKYLKKSDTFKEEVIELEDLKNWLEEKRR